MYSVVEVGAAPKGFEQVCILVLKATFSVSGTGDLERVLGMKAVLFGGKEYCLPA